MEVITTIEETKAVGLREKLFAYLELTKPRIALMLVLTSAAGFYLGAAKGFDVMLFVNSMIGIALLAFGVGDAQSSLGTQNRRADGTHRQTTFADAKIIHSEALAFGISLCLVAEIYLAFLVNGLTAILGLIVIVGYVLLYTPLKTRLPRQPPSARFPARCRR
jgi:protoheme IX farnesyltransferase